MKKINIAIDGHSSCGKSTIAKQLSKHLGYIYIDTGAMYRAVCLYALNKRIITNDGLNRENLLLALNDIEVSFEYNKENQQSQTLLNGINVENQIRSLIVSQYVSEVSKLKEVRQKLVSIQQKMGMSKGVVMDGRDIGSVVFPDAELKLFVTASIEVRAKRRHRELSDVSLEAVLDNLKMRDDVDSNRKENPLVVAKDAIIIDTTNLSLEQQFEMVLDYVRKVIKD